LRFSSRVSSGFIQEAHEPVLTVFFFAQPFHETRLPLDKGLRFILHYEPMASLISEWEDAALERWEASDGEE